MFNGKEYIYEIYKTGSFSKAAKNLYISQPALSSAVRKIETNLGAKIFNRTTTPVTLTEIGHAYINAIKQVIALEQQFKDQVNNITNLQSGHLNVAGANMFSSYMLAPIIKVFKKSYQNIKIDITESDSIDIYAHALDKNIDLIIDAGTFDHNLFTSHHITDEHILLGIPRQNPINRKLKKCQMFYSDIIDNKHITQTNYIDLSLLNNEQFIMLKPGHDMYERCFKICQNYNILPSDDTLYLNQLMTAYNLGLNGIGIVFITDTIIKLASMSDSLIYYKIDDKLAKRDIFLAHRKDAVITMAMEKFIEIAQNIYSKDSYYTKGT